MPVDRPELTAVQEIFVRVLADAIVEDILAEGLTASTQAGDEFTPA
jgi:hypothetical protein